MVLSLNEIYWKIDSLDWLIWNLTHETRRPRVDRHQNGLRIDFPLVPFHD
jgi:hypothetical protein